MSNNNFIKNFLFYLFFCSIIFCIKNNNLVFAQDNFDIDTDGDGYGDIIEIGAGYSPFNPGPIKLVDSDVDDDGLNDNFEILFKTDPYKKDTDNDGYNDFQEIDMGYNPLSAKPEKLEKKIVIDLEKQKLIFYISNQKWREFTVSTGKANTPTPVGDFVVVNKIKKAWSKSYGLWMPYWLGLDRGSIGIHELPIWPSGYREGEDHLGKPVSHGCIRLGIGSAEYLYERVDVGVKVLIN